MYAYSNLIKNFTASEDILNESLAINETDFAQCENMEIEMIRPLTDTLLQFKKESQKLSEKNIKNEKNHQVLQSIKNVDIKV